VSGEDEDKIRNLREVGEIKAEMRVMKLPVGGIAAPGYRKKF